MPHYIVRHFFLLITYKKSKNPNDYTYTPFMAGTATPRYETKMNEMKQFFGRTPAASETTPPTG